MTLEMLVKGDVRVTVTCLGVELSYVCDNRNVRGVIEELRDMIPQQVKPSLAMNETRESTWRMGQRGEGGAPRPATDKQKNYIHMLAKRANMDDQIPAVLRERGWGWSDLNSYQASELINWLKETVSVEPPSSLF